MKKVFLGLAATTLFMLGCLVPEKFDAKVTVNPDASYTFKYAGTVAHALARMTVKESGALSEKDEKDFTDEADKMREEPGMISVSHLGGGRYKLAYEISRKAGEGMEFLEAFNVYTEGDGVMTIAAIELTSKNKRELQELGIAVQGVLTVDLPSGAEVLSHNADSTPILGFGSYSWKIGGIAERPVMKLKIK